MGKLNISQITNKEAAQRIRHQLSRVDLRNKDPTYVIPLPDGTSITYKMSEIQEHVDNFMNGKKDIIGKVEIKNTKKEIAFERRSSS